MRSRIEPAPATGPNRRVDGHTLLAFCTRFSKYHGDLPRNQAIELNSVVFAQMFEDALPVLTGRCGRIIDVSKSSGAREVDALRPPGFSKHVSQCQHNASVAAVQTPLVQEIRGVDAPFGNPEVSGIGGVVELGSELQDVGFENPGVLEQAEIQVADPVRAQDIASEIAERIGRGSRGKEARAAGLEDLLHRHAGQVEARIYVGSHRGGDPPEAVSRIGASQSGKRGSGLRRQKAAELPPAQDLAGETLLRPVERQLEYAVRHKSVGPVERGAAAVGAAVE